MDTLTDEQRKQVSAVIAMDYLERVKDDLNQRNCYRRWADCTEVVSTILAGTTSVISFAASAYKDQSTLLSFIAGFTGAIGVAITGFSYYADKESRERLSRLNKLLRELKIPTEPDEAPANGAPANEQAGGADNNDVKVSVTASETTSLLFEAADLIKYNGSSARAKA